MTDKRGLFITFEGCDGSGKSTQASLFIAQLQQSGFTVTALRDPGANAISERIRAILLDRQHTEMSPWSELLLYEAARAQMVAQQIKPALEENRIVVCDRFFDSTTAYQGYGRQLDLQLVEAANRMGSGGLLPDLTCIIDADPRLIRKRIVKRLGGADRMESAGLAFQERVRQGYLRIAEAEPLRVALIPGDRSIAEIQRHIWQLFVSRFQRILTGRDLGEGEI